MNKKPNKLAAALQMGLSIPVAATVVLYPQASSAGNYTNNTNGDWGTPAIWSPATTLAPGGSDTVNVNKLGGSTVSVTSNQAAATLNVGSATRINNTLSIQSGVVSVGGNASVNAANGSKLIVQGALPTDGINVTGTLSNSRLIELASGTLKATNYANTSGSTLNVTGGSFNVGTFNQSGATGPTSTFNHSSAATSTIGSLNLSSGTISLGSNDTIKISTDYVDTTGGSASSGFGTGNSFNARAHISGSGNIVAAGSGGGVANQALASGSIPGSITDGTTATPTLNLGNVHVAATDSTGTVTKNFVITNTGTAGTSPQFRGAVQTTGVLDSRLSGNGTDPNSSTSVAYTQTGIAAAASSSDLNVTFKGDSAGAISNAATIKVVDNFGDSQTLVLKGAAYRYADPSTVSSPVTISNQHIGGTATQNLTISNNASNDGFSEGLKANIAASGGAATASGTISLLSAGSTSTNDLSVGVDTGTAGAKTGTATITLVSDGQGTSGLGTTAIGTQEVTVSGNVYRYASASSASPNPVILANQHVGDSATKALTLSNTASNDGYSEALDASISPTSGQATASGTISLLAAGATDTSSLSVGVDSSSAGQKTGQATITLVSNGDSLGLGTTSIQSQTVDVTGSVYRLASASVTQSNVTIGAQHVGDNNSANLTVSNSASADGYSEKLNAAISAAPQATASGSFNLLAAGATNSTSLSVGVDTTSAGSKSGVATITLVSDGQGTSDLGTTGITPETVNVSGDVYNYADADVIKTGGVGTLSGPSGTTWTLDMGTLQTGTGIYTANLGIENTGGILGSLTDLLEGGGWSGTGDSAFSFVAGNFSGITAGNDYGFLVNLDTTNEGTFNKQITVAWNGYNTLIGGGYVGPSSGIVLNLTGKVSAKVDEPGMVWLFGAASVGIWLSNRRKKKVNS